MHSFVVIGWPNPFIDSQLIFADPVAGRRFILAGRHADSAMESNSSTDSTGRHYGNSGSTRVIREVHDFATNNCAATIVVQTAARAVLREPFRATVAPVRVLSLGDRPACSVILPHYAAIGGARAFSIDAARKTA
jgi:hypothetical protein